MSDRYGGGGGERAGWKTARHSSVAQRSHCASHAAAAAAAVRSLHPSRWWVSLADKTICRLCLWHRQPRVYLHWFSNTYWARYFFGINICSVSICNVIVYSRSRSLYVLVRLSVVCLSVVCNVRASYSGDSNFRQCFYAIWYLGHPLTYSGPCSFFTLATINSL